MNDGEASNPTMSDAVKIIHALLTTLSHAELCEVIKQSADLCATMSLQKKKPTVAPAPAPPPKQSPASKQPVTPAECKDEKPVDIGKRFADLLGWGASSKESVAASELSEDSKEYDENGSDENIVVAEENMAHAKKCRDMAKCFTHGQRIRHTVGDKIRVGTYDSSKDAIIYNGTPYNTLTKFATAHVLAEYNPNRASSRDGWKHCECEVKGKWISTYNLSG
jgi:hypothetical protein